RDTAAAGRHRRQCEGDVQQRCARDRRPVAFIRRAARPPRGDHGRGGGAEVESTEPEDVGNSCTADGAGGAGADREVGPCSPCTSDATSTGGSTATRGGGACGGMS